MIGLIRFAPWIGGALAFGALVGWHLLQTRAAYNEGFEAALATVETMDRRASDAARDARSAVDACFDMEGTWDAISASCRLAE